VVLLRSRFAWLWAPSPNIYVYDQIIHPSTNKKMRKKNTPLVSFLSLGLHLSILVWTCRDNLNKWHPYYRVHTLELVSRTRWQSTLSSRSRGGDQPTMVQAGMEGEVMWSLLSFISSFENYRVNYFMTLWWLVN